MNVEKILAGLPSKTPAERRAIVDNAERWLRTGTTEQRKSASAVVSALEGIEKQEAETLAQHVAGLPKATRVAEAFNDPPMTETERAVVQALLDHPHSTSTALTEALGWRGQAWHLHFGTMCFNRRARLWPAPPSEARDADFYSGILADFEGDTSSFTINPEAAAGFAAIGIKAAKVD
ncbi:hypothetical protein GCM10022280_18850 [Sphingomonas swuensis]|uniref:Uncharacterized protein n=1 Tax=Sphingomonas swuensis TaxID=977800 RepID=A0ABP7T0K3_9SPHN